MSLKAHSNRHLIVFFLLLMLLMFNLFLSCKRSQNIPSKIRGVLIWSARSEIISINLQTRKEKVIVSKDLNQTWSFYGRIARIKNSDKFLCEVSREELGWNREIVLFDFKGNTDWEFASKRISGISPTVSPDGKHYAFLRDNKIILRSFENDNERVLTDTIDSISYLLWISHDSLLFGKVGESWMWSVNPENGKIIQWMKGWPCALSADEQMLVYQADDNSVVMIDLQSGQKQTAFKRWVKRGVSVCSCSPDNKYLLMSFVRPFSITENRDLYILEIETGKKYYLRPGSCGRIIWLNHNEVD